MNKFKFEPINKFENKNIDLSKFYGGWKNIVNTGPGIVQGMTYTSDYLADDNQDGQWSTGESVTFNWDMKAGKM